MTPVIIVGAGTTGLAAAAFLAQQGVDCLVLDRRAAPSAHPRARGLTRRAMELLRAIGLEEAVRAAGEPKARSADAVTLADEDYRWRSDPVDPDRRPHGPVPPWLCDQARLERLLLDRARELGATVCFRFDVSSVEPLEEQVIVRGPDVLRAEYLVAADGANSAIREQLGIRRHGPGVLGQRQSVLFQADLAPAVRGREFTACHLAGGAVLIPRGDPAERSWQVTIPDSEEPVEQRIRSLTGLPALEIEALDVQPFTLAALVAERFRAGRVLLAGDAAHVMPPSGGFGVHCGIGDAHNLAWKLAAGGDLLLDSYEAERAPLARFTVDQAVLRWRGDPSFLPKPVVSEGFRYRSSDDPDIYEDPRHPTGRPGTRAPHIVLPDGSSTLDLFGAGFTLLTTDAGLWPEPCHRIGHADGYGIEPGGAVLVRPDGVIAWRSRTAVPDPEAALRRALSIAYGRG